MCFYKIHIIHISKNCLNNVHATYNNIHFHFFNTWRVQSSIKTMLGLVKSVSKMVTKCESSHIYSVRLKKGFNCNFLFQSLLLLKPSRTPAIKFQYIYTCVITCPATVSNIQQPQELFGSLGTRSIQT